jgi:magnesium chelatase family protein
MCRCAAERIEAYRARISGPLLDRIDLHVEVPRVSAEAISSRQPAEASAVVASRVAAARDRQLERQRRSNARLEAVGDPGVFRASPEALDLLDRAMRTFALSARAYHRVLRVARTIADLANSDPVSAGHVAEAVALRQLDRRSGTAPLALISA